MLADGVNADLIGEVPFFAWLTAEQAQGLADQAVRRRLRRGETFVEPGAKSEAVYVLLSGRARVWTADEKGREVTLAVLRPGAVAGETSLIDDEPHLAAVNAQVPMDVLVVPRSDFARCLPERSSLSYALICGLVRRLRSANQQIQSLALLDVHSRVARTLLDMSEQVDGARVVRTRLSRKGLSEIIGASRERVGSVMRDLELQGLVKTGANGWLTIEEELIC